MNPSRPWRHLLLALVTLGVLALKGWCELGLPFPPEDDAVRFLPQILHARQDGRAINTLCANPSGDRLSAHVIAALMPRADYPSLALVLFVGQALVLLALAVFAAGLKHRDWPTTVAAAAAILCYAALPLLSQPGPLLLMVLIGVPLALLQWRGVPRPVAFSLPVALVFVVVGVVASGPLLMSSALRIYTDHGLDRAEATFLVGQIMEEEPGRIDFTPALFTLTTHPRGVCLTEADFLPDGSIRSQAELVLVQQIRPYKDLPPQFRNYTLVRNYFCSYRPGYGSFRFAESPRVYNFAVYRRIEYRAAW